jgi:hypothetical protein
MFHNIIKRFPRSEVSHQGGRERWEGDGWVGEGLTRGVLQHSLRAILSQLSGARESKRGGKRLAPVDRKMILVS